VSRPFKFPPLAAISLTLAVLVALPVLAVGANLLTGGTGETWRHLLATVLPEYVSNSIWLCLGVGLGVAAMGTGAAWLTAMHDFPGRRVFEWALVLPLAMPAYVLAYVYTDFLQFVGPLQTWLRESFGWSRGDYWFPDVRTLGGASRACFRVRALSLCLHDRAHGLLSWSGQAACWRRRKNARASARGQGFFRVSLPLARPAVAAGVALALMETLADYGTVSYFAVQTFTTGIYRAWFSLGDRIAAAQLAALLLGFVVLLLITAEKVSAADAPAFTTRPAATRPLSGTHACPDGLRPSQSAFARCP
jgi:iron(III) transport system permease protein